MCYYQVSKSINLQVTLVANEHCSWFFRASHSNSLQFLFTTLHQVQVSLSIEIRSSLFVPGALSPELQPSLVSFTHAPSSHACSRKIKTNWNTELRLRSFSSRARLRPRPLVTALTARQSHPCVTSWSSSRFLENLRVISCQDMI